VTCASKSLAEGGAFQELSHLILSAGLTLAVVAREKASPLDGRTRVRFTPVSGRLAAKSWSLLCAISGHHGPADEEITLVARLPAAPPHTWHDPLVDEMVA
jgi:hypothetical protein